MSSATLETRQLYALDTSGYTSNLLCTVTGNPLRVSARNSGSTRTVRQKLMETMMRRRLTDIGINDRFVLVCLCEHLTTTPQSLAAFGSKSPTRALTRG